MIKQQTCKQLRQRHIKKNDGTLKFMKSNRFIVPRPQSDIVEYSSAVADN
jgi:hypothetical protein